MPHRSLALAVLLALSAPAAAQSFVARPQILSPQWIEVMRRADFDGDGFEEVFAREVTFTPNPVHVWEADSEDAWSSTRAENVGFFPPPEIADFDGDGLMDFALVDESWLVGPAVVYYGTPEGQPFIRQEVSPSATAWYSEIAAPDFDGDGDADLLVMNYQELIVVRNDGARQYTTLYVAQEAFNARSYTAADVDGDGREDLVSEGLGGLAWRRSQGNGRFEPPAPLVSGTGLSWELEAQDVDMDGDKDIVCRLASAFGVGGGDRTSYWVQLDPGGAAVLRNDHLTVPGAAERIADVRDLNLDGIPDMLLVTDDHVALRLGLGGGDFGPASIYPTPSDPGFAERAAIIVDVDGDGDEDILRGTATWLENIDHPGTPTCPGGTNSVGSGARLYGAGSDLISRERLTLNATGLPPAAFGMFFTSLDGAPPTTVPGSAGQLCLGGSIGRFDRPGEIRPANTAGVLRLPLRFGDIPDAVQGSVAIVAPETRYFQLWYRDTSPSGSTSNFSDALRVELR